MELEFPQVAMIDCRDCCKHVYDLDKGEREEYEVGDGVSLPVVRNFPPPCGTCPKGEMDLAGKKALSPRARQAFQIWSEIQATKGSQPVPKHLEGCAVFAATMAMISRAFEASEARITNRAYEEARKGR